MDGNDQDPKPCLGISITADTIHPTEKDRRKNDREDDKMPREPTSLYPTTELNLKNQHRKPHTYCTMEGNDRDPKPRTGISTTADTTPQRKIEGNDREDTLPPRYDYTA